MVNFIVNYFELYQMYLIKCVCVFDMYDVWGIYSGEYVSQLYVGSRPHVHLIYHPVDALKWAK